MSEEEIGLTGEQEDLSRYVTDEGGIWSLRQLEKVRGWNNIEYAPGLSGKNTPSTGLSMNRAYILEGSPKLISTLVSMSWSISCRVVSVTSMVRVVGSLWCTARATCSTLNRVYRTRFSTAQIPNGYTQLSPGRTHPSGRI